MSKFAIKRLTKSDLTFFVWHFRNMNAGNQKSINLNANVFVDVLYPDIPNISAKLGKTFFLVDLSIFGPGKTPKHSLARKIVKGAAYKNWRLNGEFVESPLDTPDRYSSLREGDYAILDFTGELYPEALSIVFVAASLVDDQVLHSRIAAAMGNSSMRAFSSEALAEVIGDVGVDESHAAKMAGIESALEDASQGGLAGMQTLQAWSSKRPISTEDLLRAKDKAHAVGMLGEELVDYYLDGNGFSYVWESRINAASAYDFLIKDEQYLDVKSTEGVFDRTIHVSMNELLHMRELQDYRIYRIYKLDNKRAKLRISEHMGDFARQTLKVLESLPAGVTVDSVSIKPSQLKFDDEIEIEMFSLETVG